MVTSPSDAPAREELPESPTQILAAELGQGHSRRELVVRSMDLIVALPALFWRGVWIWRRCPLGHVVAGLLLLKSAFSTSPTKRNF